MDQSLHFDNIIAQKTTYDAGTFMPWHTDRFSRISITIEGESEETTKSQHACLSSSMLVTKPNTALHETRFGKKSTTILSIQFPDESLFLPSFRNWACYKHPSLSLRGLKLWSGLKKVKNDVQVMALLEELNTLIHWLKHQEQSKKHHLQQADYLFSEDEGQRSVQDVAGELFLHRVSFSRSFKKQFNVSPKVYSNQVRLLKAVSGIVKGNEPLASVAYQAGYADQSHMNRSFKKVFDCTPLEFRKRSDR